jgi:hypothetical protein
MPFLIICSRQYNENRGHILTFNSWLNLDVVKM